MRLIDADKLPITNTYALVNSKVVKPNKITFAPLACVLKSDIDNATTVDERPKGKWIGDTDYESCQGNYEAYKCSECGYGIGWRKHHQLMCQDKIPEEYREYYCPHCGADMRR